MAGRGSGWGPPAAVILEGYATAETDFRHLTICDLGERDLRSQLAVTTHRYIQYELGAQYELTLGKGTYDHSSL